MKGNSLSGGHFMFLGSCQPLSSHPIAETFDFQGLIMLFYWRWRKNQHNVLINCL